MDEIAVNEFVSNIIQGILFLDEAQQRDALERVFRAKFVSIRIYRNIDNIISALTTKKKEYALNRNISAGKLSHQMILTHAAISLSVHEAIAGKFFSFGGFVMLVMRPFS